MSDRIFFKKIRKYRIGYHTNLKNSILETLLPEPETLQFYAGGHTSYGTRNITEFEKNVILEYCTKKNKTFYIHSSLICNLAKECNEKSIEHLNNELELVRNLPAAVVVHCGKVGTISKISESINSLNLRRGTFNSFEKQLVLENASGQGTELGKNLDEVRKIFEGIDKNLVGLCIDTQHIFSSGVCPFREKKDIDELFENYFDFGLRVIHLNDSKTDFGSRVDRHENIGAGKIWGENVFTLKYLLNRCSDKKIDMILETPNQILDYERLKVFTHSL